MTKPDEEDIINFINEKLNKSEPAPADLEVELPPPGVQGQWVRGLLIEDATEHPPWSIKSRPKPKSDWPPPRRPKIPPKPPYRCACGTTFATAQELLDHRHTNADIEARVAKWRSWKMPPKPWESPEASPPPRPPKIEPWKKT